MQRSWSKHWGFVAALQGSRGRDGPAPVFWSIKTVPEALPARFPPPAPPSGVSMPVPALRAAALTATLAFGAAWALPHPALAAATPEQAADLARILDQRMVQWFAPDGDEGAAVQWEGTVQVEPDGDRYAVRLPPLSVVADDGSTLEIGTIRLDLTPAEGGTYEVAATVPDMIPIVDPEGTPVGELAVGRQRFAGVWSVDAESFLSLDADYGNLTLKALDVPAALGIKSLTLRQKLEERAPDRWDGPSRLG